MPELWGNRYSRLDFIECPLLSNPLIRNCLLLCASSSSSTASSSASAFSRPHQERLVQEGKKGKNGSRTRSLHEITVSKRLQYGQGFSCQRVQATNQDSDTLFSLKTEKQQKNKTSIQVCFFFGKKERDSKLQTKISLSQFLFKTGATTQDFSGYIS